MTQKCHKQSSLSTQLRIGISRCLLGEHVRYDGGHKYDEFLLRSLAPHVEWIPICPEVEMGMSTPRETLGLFGAPQDPSLLTNHSRINHTEPMKIWIQKRLQELEQAQIHGFVLKKSSPSCGLLKVKLYHLNGKQNGYTRGVFAAAIVKKWPSLPVKDESQLQDMNACNTFLAQAIAYRKLTTPQG